MIKTKINLNNLLFFFILLLSILPIVNIAGFDMPVLYFLLPISAFVFLFVIFGWVKVPRFVKYWIGYTK